MRKIVFVLAGAAALSFSGVAAGMATPLGLGGYAINDAADSANLVEQAAVYVVRGQRYCFYFDGWHGAGWYRCGFSWRRGLGWGGAYGWMGWDYGPARRRFGGGGRFFDRNRDMTIREGRGGTGDRSFTRGGAGVRDRGSVSGGTRSGNETTGQGRTTGSTGDVGRSPSGARGGASGSGGMSGGGTTSPGASGGASGGVSGGASGGVSGGASGGISGGGDTRGR